MMVQREREPEISRRSFLAGAAGALAGMQLKGAGACAADIPKDVRETFKRTAQAIRVDDGIKASYSTRQIEAIANAAETKLPAVYMRTLREYERESGVDLEDSPPAVEVKHDLRHKGKKVEGMYDAGRKTVSFDADVMLNLGLVEPKMDLPPGLEINVTGHSRGDAEVTARHEFTHYWDKRDLEEGRVDWIARMDGQSLKPSTAGYGHSSMNWGLFAYVLGRGQGRDVEAALNEGTKHIEKMSFTGNSFDMIRPLEAAGLAGWREDDYQKKIMKAFLSGFTKEGGNGVPPEEIARGNLARTDAVLKLASYLKIEMEPAIEYMAEQGEMRPWVLNDELRQKLSPLSETVRGKRLEPAKPSVVPFDGKKILEGLK